MSGIFISCVSREFHGETSPDAVPWQGSYRTKLSDYLRSCEEHVVDQESLTQGGGDLLKKLEDCIVGCKAVIHLIGREPGWSPDDDLPPSSEGPSDAVHALLARHRAKKHEFLAGRQVLRQQLVDRAFRGISATQWEAYFAIHHEIPLFVFTFSDSAERAPDYQPIVSRRKGRLTQSEHFELLRLTCHDRLEEARNQDHFILKVIAALQQEGIHPQKKGTHPRSHLYAASLRCLTLLATFIGLVLLSIILALNIGRNAEPSVKSKVLEFEKLPDFHGGLFHDGGPLEGFSSPEAKELLASPTDDAFNQRLRRGTKTTIVNTSRFFRLSLKNDAARELMRDGKLSFKNLPVSVRLPVSEKGMSAIPPCIVCVLVSTPLTPRSSFKNFALAVIDTDYQIEANFNWVSSAPIVPKTSFELNFAAIIIMKRELESIEETTRLEIW